MIITCHLEVATTTGQLKIGKKHHFLGSKSDVEAAGTIKVERSIKSVLNETVNTNGGKILFDITGVNIEKSIKGGLVHTTELALKGEITELELQML